MQEKLFFYYTNDLHSNFENWSKAAGYIKESKEQRDAANQSSWAIDIGDHVDRVHPIAEAYLGKANVQLMNEAGYDVATIGNNEGITLPHDDLFHLYDEADFEVTCANLHNMNGKKPEWLNPVVQVKSVNGVRVGLIGLTAPFNAFYELLDWHISPPMETLGEYVEEIKQSTDVIILLSHLGISEDQEIARRFKDIDVIIGGHTHHLLRTGETINQTLLTAAGKHCAFVGEVILTWDHERNKLVKKEAYTTDTSNLPRDLQTEERLQQLAGKADLLLGEPVVTINNPIEVQWFNHTEIMQRLTDTLLDWTDADVAFLNAGLLLEQFSAGTVTYGDIHRICPHPVNPVVVELKGDELLEVIRASLTKDLTELKLKGFGFRGEIIGKMIFSGIEVDSITQDNGHEYVHEVWFNGQLLNPDTTYMVATADIFTFGRLLPEVARSQTKNYFLPEFMRDLLTETLKKYFSNH